MQRSIIGPRPADLGNEHDPDDAALLIRDRHKLRARHGPVAEPATVPRLRDSTLVLGGAAGTASSCVLQRARDTRLRRARDTLRPCHRSL
jgi:hypothetical protein